MTRYKDAYRREIAHFVDCLITGSAPLVTGTDGLEALVLAEEYAGRVYDPEGKCRVKSDCLDYRMIENCSNLKLNA